MARARKGWNINFDMITGEQAGVVLYCAGAGRCRPPKVDPCRALAGSQYK